tara:strand:+ start:988 stop:1569 length:582 start_codon:yes stop_codon:yes gene_type:complete
MTLAALAGLAAPLIYLAAVMAGSWATPGYDQLAMPISALMAGGAGPAWLYGLLLAYNLTLLGFGLSLPIARTRLSLVASAVVGIGMLIFPMDAIGAPMRATGMVHLMLAGVASLTSLVAIAGGMRHFSRRRERRRAWISALALGFVLVTGVLTAAGTAAGWPIAGLLERLTIGGFLVWIGWLACQPAPGSMRA